MTQEERWLPKYNAVMDYLEKNRQNLSRYNDNERDLSRKKLLTFTENN